MAFGPITLWQTEGEKVETVTDLIFLGSNITVDGDCSHEIIKHTCALEGKLINLDNVIKSEDFILPAKVHIVKAMVFPVAL